MYQKNSAILQVSCMKEVFDWKAFGGCFGGIAILIVIGIVILIGYFLINILLFLLPVILAGLVILAIPFLLWYLFKIMFFRKPKN